MASVRRLIRGQGLTEYLIVVALIATGAFGIYSAFGDWDVETKNRTSIRQEDMRAKASVDDASLNASSVGVPNTAGSDSD